MATYTVGSGGDYTTLQTCFASGVLANTDTVQILSGYNVTEQVGSGVSWVDSVTVIGDVADPSNAVIQWNNPTSATYSYAMTIGGNANFWVFKGLTLNYTGAHTTGSSCFYGGWGGHSDLSFEDCRVNSSGQYGFYNPGPTLSLKRCRIDNSTNTTNASSYGVGFASTMAMESCLLIDWGYYGVLASGVASVSNTTVYQGKGAGLVTAASRQLYLQAAGSSFTNCVVQTTYSAGGSIGITGGGGSGTITNCIIFGFNYDISGSTGYTQTAVTVTAGVGSNPVLVDPAAGDFYPADPGLALSSGTPSAIPAGGDLNAQSFNNPPSMGALEVLPAPAAEVATDYGPFVIPPPNISAVTNISVPNSTATPAQVNDIYLGRPSIGSVVSLVSDFTGAGTAGDRFWLASGTLGASDAQYITLYDTGSDASKYLRTRAAIQSIYAVYVDSAGKRLVWDQDSPSDPASGEPTAVTYYIPTSNGRLVPVYYASGAAALYAKLTCPNAALAATTNDIIGANTGSPVEIQTSGRVCLVNMEV